MDRPTFSPLEQMSNGEVVLAISMDNYGYLTSVLRFSKNNVSEYQSLITKYLDWGKLAKSRDDAFTKEIGVATTWGNGLSVNLKFTFYSGNASTHFLSVSSCGVGTCLDDQSLYFDSKNAHVLEVLLGNLQSGLIQQKNIDSVYQ